MAWKGKTYSEKLRDPRWQKKRLEVMSGSKFECEFCGAKDKTLNVHHKLYRRGAQPWEYANGDLECLCEDCHKNTEALRSELAELLACGGALLERVIGYASAIVHLNGDSDGVYASTYERCEGISDAIRSSVKEVIKAGMQSGNREDKIDLDECEIPVQRYKP
jgi:hypothetical protein